MGRQKLARFVDAGVRQDVLDVLGDAIVRCCVSLPPGF